MEKSEPENAIDAINEALGLEEAVENDEAVETEIADDEADGLESDAEGDDSGADDEDGDGDEEGEGSEDEESGEEGEPTEAAKAAAKAAGKPVSEFNPDGTPKKPEPKKPDPVNDPIPKDLKKETSDRMRSLIKMTRDVTAERDQVRGDFDTIINGIKASGSSPEQYGEAISWLSLFNSPKVEDRTKAYELVNDIADRMAMLLGIDRTVKDILADHPDLKAAVAAGKIAPEFAREMARTRGAKKLTASIAEGQQQQQQTQEQKAAEDRQARADLNAFDTEMRAKDPLYDAKRKQIVPILRPIFKTLPKAQWAQAYKEAYAEARVKPQGKGPKKTTSQPLRGGKQPAGGQTRQPTSALEAMNGALNSMK